MKSRSKARRHKRQLARGLDPIALELERVEREKEDRLVAKILAVIPRPRRCLTRDEAWIKYIQSC